MTFALFILAAGLMVPAVGVRLLFLAETRLGWLNYLPNVFSETFVKRAGWPRGLVEWLCFAAALPVLWLATSALWMPLLALAAMCVVDLAIKSRERTLLTADAVFEDQVGPAGASLEPQKLPAFPTPSVHPILVLNLEGPFVERSPHYDLGHLVAGRQVTVTCLIGNHARTDMQATSTLTLSTTGGVEAHLTGDGVVGPLRAGQVARVAFTITVRRREPGVVRLCLPQGGRQQIVAIRCKGVLPAAAARFSSATVTRYPGACRAAFAWRGDMDLYDTATLQSIEGLEIAFGLSARFRMPQTMYLSTRLSLDMDAAQAYAEHFGIERGWRHIPDFIAWMNEKVDLRHACTYPFASTKPYVIELGNHGHLHYGTDTAAAKENLWKPRAKIGAGQYPWVSEGADAFTEQRDNALEARRWIETCFNYSPRSWAMPDRTRDGDTPRAMVAAGCKVLSDSDVRTLDNVLRQPPPHHPLGTEAVELTKRYPGDPQHIYHLAMNKFWMHRAHRLGIPMIFMCHQHMRNFEGHACTRLTEQVLRHVLTRFNGDLHINTVYGIGDWWHQVLSPHTRVLNVGWTETACTVENRGDTDLSNLPVDVRFADGSVATYLLDLPAHSAAEFVPDGRCQTRELAHA